MIHTYTEVADSVIIKPIGTCLVYHFLYVNNCKYTWLSHSIHVKDWGAFPIIVQMCVHLNAKYIIGAFKDLLKSSI